MSRTSWGTASAPGPPLPERSPPPAIRVLLLGDDPLARGGLAFLLAGEPDLVVVAQADAAGAAAAPGRGEPQAAGWGPGAHPLRRPAGPGALGGAPPPPGAPLPPREAPPAAPPAPPGWGWCCCETGPMSEPELPPADPVAGAPRFSWLDSPAARWTSVLVPAAFLCGLAWLLPKEVFWITDGGNRFIQVQSFDL